MANFTKRYSSRTIALLLLAAVAVVIGILLYFEQIAVLYVLATVALVALMLTVALSNLEDVDRDAVDGFAPEKK